MCACNKCSYKKYILTHLQVCAPGLSNTLGIFTKLFTLFEQACHTIDLKPALYSPTAPISSSQFDEYSKALKDLIAIISELETVHQEKETFQQLATCCSIVAGNYTPFIGSILDLSNNWHEKRKALASHLCINNYITNVFNTKGGSEKDD